VGISNKGRLTFTSSLINNISSFFLIAALLAFAFYLAGTKHDFTENTQLLMLKIIFASAVFVFIINAVSVILDVISAAVNKKPLALLLIILYIILAVLAAALAIFSGAVLVLSGGNKI
jgi:hypothetical protein